MPGGPSRSGARAGAVRSAAYAAGRQTGSGRPVEGWMPGKAARKRRRPSPLRNNAFRRRPAGTGRPEGQVLGTPGHQEPEGDPGPNQPPGSSGADFMRNLWTACE